MPEHISKDPKTSNMTAVDPQIIGSWDLWDFFASDQRKPRSARQLRRFPISLKCPLVGHQFPRISGWKSARVQILGLSPVVETLGVVEPLGEVVRSNGFGALSGGTCLHIICSKWALAQSKSWPSHLPGQAPRTFLE